MQTNSLYIYQRIRKLFTFNHSPQNQPKVSDVEKAALDFCYICQSGVCCLYSKLCRIIYYWSNQLKFPVHVAGGYLSLRQCQGKLLFRSQPLHSLTVGCLASSRWLILMCMTPCLMIYSSKSRVLYMQWKYKHGLNMF